MHPFRVLGFRDIDFSVICFFADKRIWLLGWAQSCVHFSVAAFWILWAPTIVVRYYELWSYIYYLLTLIMNFTFFYFIFLIHIMMILKNTFSNWKATTYLHLFLYYSIFLSFLSLTSFHFHLFLIKTLDFEKSTMFFIGWWERS